MSVVLRHKKLPFIVVYSDPKKSWDATSKKRLLEEIRKDGFDKFVEESSVPPLFRKLFNISKSQAKRIEHGLKEADVRRKHTDSLDRLHEEEGTSSVEEENHVDDRRSSKT